MRLIAALTDEISIWHYLTGVGGIRMLGIAWSAGKPAKGKRVEGILESGSSYMQLRVSVWLPS